MTYRGAGTIRGPLHFVATPSPGVSPLGEGRIYFDSVSNTFKVSENNGAFVNLSGPGSANTLATTLGNGNVTGTNDILVTSGQQIDTATAAVLNLGNTNATALGIGNPSGGLSAFQIFVNQGGASFSSNAGFQLSSTTSNRAAARFNQFGSNTGVPGFVGFKSRGTNVADLASVADGDILARMTAIGVTGNNTDVPLAGFVDVRVPTGGTNATWVATDFSVSLVPLAGPINSIRQVSRITSEAAFELIDGTTAAVSPANKGQVRYNNTTKTFQQSVDGGAWTSIATTTSSTLQQDYTNGGAGGGAITLTGSGGPIALTNPLGANQAAISITQNATAAGASGIEFTTAGDATTPNILAGSGNFYLRGTGGFSVTLQSSNALTMISAGNLDVSLQAVNYNSALSLQAVGAAMLNAGDSVGGTNAGGALTVRGGDPTGVNQSTGGLTLSSGGSTGTGTGTITLKVPKAGASGAGANAAYTAAYLTTSGPNGSATNQNLALEMFDYAGSSASEAAVVRFFKARGTSVAPTAVLSGDVLGAMNARGYGATGFSNVGNSGYIQFSADENFTDSAMGGSIAFATTPLGSVTPAQRWMINAPGHLLAVADATYDIGAVGANRPRNVYIAGEVVVTAPNTAPAIAVTGQYYSAQFTCTTTLNWNDGNAQAMTLANGAQTFTFSNAQAGGRYLLKLKQPAAGAAGTVTWPASVLWSGGTPPTLTATNGQTDIVTFYYDGTNFFGGYTLNY